MDRTMVFTAAFAICLLGAACAAAQQETFDAAPLIDLTGDLARDVAGQAIKSDSLDASIYPCGLKEQIANNGLI